MKNKQHYQLPNEMGINQLRPKDQLVYVALKSFDGKNGCFPSLVKISERVGASINTIRASIQRLIETDYITVTKKGRCSYYNFNKYKNFEPFSPEFLNNKNISTTTKAFIVATQQYMYKDQENYGKLSYTNRELSKKINMPEATIRLCNAELEKKNYLNVLKNESIDPISGCKTDTKLYNLNELGQAVIWALQNHEERITKTEATVSELQNKILAMDKKLKEKDKLIECIQKQLNIKIEPETDFTL